MIVRESQRFYDIQGNPVETVLSADGKKQIKPDIRHGLKYNLFPSVTTVLKLKSNYQLDRWKKNKIAELAFENPKYENENISNYQFRINNEFELFLESKRDVGKDYHKAIQLYLQDGILSEDKAELNSINGLKRFIDINGITEIISERSFTDKQYGYSGTPDFIGINKDKKTVIIDFKSTDIKKFIKYNRRPWDDWKYQIAAYSKTIQNSLFDFYCFEYIIDQETGDNEFYQWGADEIEFGWKVFYHLLQIWHIENYDPRESKDNVLFGEVY